MSKLAALAAKRRQKEKENEKPSTTQDAELVTQRELPSSLQELRAPPKSYSDLSKKNLIKQKAFIPTLNESSHVSGSISKPDRSDLSVAVLQVDSTPSLGPLESATVNQATPSLFAATITATTQSHSPLNIDATLASHFASALNLNDTPTKPFDFTDPSPDDVVTKAQTSKGSSRE